VNRTVSFENELMPLNGRMTYAGNSTLPTEAYTILYSMSHIEIEFMIHLNIFFAIITFPWSKIKYFFQLTLFSCICFVWIVADKIRNTNPVCKLY